MAATPLLQELENGLPAICTKTALILRGNSDFAFRERERSRFQGAFPNHKRLDLTGAGHFVQEDAPDALSEAIATWFVEDAAGLQRPNAIA